MKLLLAEDNERLAERISHKLKAEYVVDTVLTGNEAINQASMIDYDAIILDLGLPDINGLEVCTQIRKEGLYTPVLILTASGAVGNRVQLLNAGADDFMSKPFDINELKARLQALYRRKPQPIKGGLITYKDIKIDRQEHRVFRGNIELQLRRKEYDILEYLILNQGRILTRKMIMDHVWSADSTSWVSTVDVHIKHLRDKIDRPFDDKYIKTSYGLGYKLDKAP